MSTDDKLRFKVAPHLVQDLGLNLYTSLGRVLAEFVANAHDADSNHADIRIDFGKIEAERKKLSAEWKLEQAKAEAAGKKVAATLVLPLGQRTLPASVTIEIEDRGCGMSRRDFQTCFLVVGRRRRDEDPEDQRIRTPKKKRLFMGLHFPQKPLTKLSG